jgi:hypothetical protein
MIKSVVRSFGSLVLAVGLLATVGISQAAAAEPNKPIICNGPVKIFDLCLLGERASQYQSAANKQCKDQYGWRWTATSLRLGGVRECRKWI